MSQAKRLLVIGASDAGISSALRAKELNPSLDVAVVAADEYPNFSICGLPHFLGGEVRAWQDLAHRTREDLEEAGIRLFLRHRAVTIDNSKKTVEIIDEREHQTFFPYDRLVLATGAVSRRPDIPGIGLTGVFFLRWMDDGLKIQRYLASHRPQKIVLIGGGYIGAEMAEAMLHRRLQVEVVERSQVLLRHIDPEFSRSIQAELESQGARIHTGFTVEKIEYKGQKLHVISSRGRQIPADMVLVAVGCLPQTELAASAGIRTGKHGAIQVTRRMETNIPGIYAAGDCVETWNRILKSHTYQPLGTVAHKQGRIAGENAAGGDRKFSGTLGTQSIKIMNLVYARTGLLAEEAVRAGYDPVSSRIETYDHKSYYPGACSLKLIIIGDRMTRRLLGAQILGSQHAEISKRLDILACALYHQMAVGELEDLDLSYTPPLSTPWDPIQTAAQAWVQVH
jgi:NADPH-dependent 2,4-dienoyl-CoA reductase/sulfur reductase-like enzyme